MNDLPLVRRFLRKTWSPERSSIDAMAIDDRLQFAASQYANIKSSVERLNHAYEGMRVWRMTTVALAATVERVK